jgi:hypothetical protein
VGIIERVEIPVFTGMTKYELFFSLNCFFDLEGFGVSWLFWCFWVYVIPAQAGIHENKYKTRKNAEIHN